MVEACCSNTVSNSDLILQHLLQHIWSTLKFPKQNSKRKVENTRPVAKSNDFDIQDASVATENSPTSITETVDELGNEQILRMAGWCFKRTREIIKSGSVIIEIKQGKGFKPDEVFLVEQEDVLHLIKCLGSDVLAEDGNYYFEPHPSLLNFFKYTHKQCRALLRSNIKLGKNDAVIACLKIMSVDNKLRILWKEIISELAPNTDDPASIVLLTNLVHMLVKAKQKREIEVLDLQPNMKSKSLRATVGSSHKKPKRKAVKVSSNKKSLEKDADSIPKEIIEIREQFAQPEALLHKLLSLTGFSHKDS